MHLDYYPDAKKWRKITSPKELLELVSKCPKSIYDGTWRMYDEEKDTNEYFYEEKPVRQYSNVQYAPYYELTPNY